MTEAEIVAKLDKPGAGVPFMQGLLFRYIVGPFISKKYSWEENRRAFEKTTQALLREIEGMTDEQLARRVLVPPQRGLEDSSRYWSAAMLFEHLVIVGKGVKGGIISLSKGVVPDVKVDTGRVKPLGQLAPSDAIAQYKQFSSAVMDEIDREAKDRDAKVTLTHPWFGPLTARQWHWLIAVHQGIHLQQLRAIVKAVTAPK